MMYMMIVFSIVDVPQGKAKTQKVLAPRPPAQKLIAASDMFVLCRICFA